ncbi:MAG: ABC transporter ATP-binding protein, partial [Bdellovibrionales bacterium]|nr:ABC transporter ATP-binding protein [Bdellovibrionales bacterium]
STLIKSVLDLLPFESGQIETSWQADSRKLIPEQHMAFCPENGAVFADITVENYVKLWSRIKQGNPRYYLKEGGAVIELLQLTPLFKKLGRELSKGQRRRVQTAIGFLSNPKLFLFDEPFDGLDVQKTSELVSIIREYNTATAFIISSHRMDVVERIADRIVVLKEGKIVSNGNISQVCRDLGGEYLVIRNISNPGLLVSALRQSFPQVQVQQIGDDITLNALKLNENEIGHLVQEIDNNGARLELSKPNLVDAMNLHLASI